MKKGMFIALSILLMSFFIFADEGMFPPNEFGNLPRMKLKKMGLQIPVTQIEKKIAKAVVIIDGGTGSFVSHDGLIITNHHVGFGAIQYNSSSKHNYIKDGFYAPTPDKELRAPGYEALVYQGWKNVTSAVLSHIKKGMTPRQRYQAVEDAVKLIEKQEEAKQKSIRVRVVSMYHGAQYILFKYLRIKDIRLVYAPPDSIGNFGGDIDNFEWPRQVGDFSIFRAYVSKNGSPSDYSKSNVPYHPDVYLPISMRPLKKGDFAMVIGYPGSTNRYLSAKEIKLMLKVTLPLKIRLFTDIIGILDNISKENSEYAVRVASLEKGLNNALKYYQGVQDGLVRDQVVAKFKTRDKLFEKWLKTNGKSVADQGILDKINRLNDKVAKTLQSRTISAYLSRITSCVSAGGMIGRWAEEKKKPDLERSPEFMDRNITSLKKRLRFMQRNLLVEKDKKVMTYFLVQMSSLPEIEQCSTFKKWFGKLSADKIKEKVGELFAKTKLNTIAGRLAYFNKSEEELRKVDDPLLKFSWDLAEELHRMDETDKAMEGKMMQLRPRFIKLLQAFAHKERYPDANRTIRLTYGKVKGYSEDGVIYTPFTTLQGVIAKERGREPFKSPLKLINLYKKHDYGIYADPYLGGEVPVDFLTDNDTTGGNSGSPTLNGRGELIGLLFDGNFESISSDYYFNPALTRSIVVDSRYILFILDKFSNARQLLKELKIVK